MRSVRVAFMLLGIMLVFSLIAGCGDDDDDANQPTATQAPPTATEDVAGDDPTITTGSPTATIPLPTPDTTATSTESLAATATEADEVTLNVYFIRDEHLTVGHRTIPHTLAVGTAAMQALLAGPSQFESELGFSSAIPEGSDLLGLTIEDGIATVDLSAEFESGGGSFSVSARLVQVIYTLTQFPTVDAVEFLLEGEPVGIFSGEGVVIDGPAGRASGSLLPAIFVESVAAGDSVSSPVTIAGTANTFEATFIARIVTDAGEVLTEQVVTATSGSGTRGTFEATISFEADGATPGKLVVFEYSARDGSPINVIEIPVTLQP
ncbi:hypothetical protein BH23CHL2_BH23CHL2_32970 [soil metagenome]